MGYGIEDWTVVTAQEPGTLAAGNGAVAAKSALASAPGFSTKRDQLTIDCDPCTSGFFPKRDDGNEH